MAFITELDIVNACLKSMGEQPLNSITTGAPIVTSAQESMRLAMMEEQGQGWWFNRETIKLIPDINQQYSIPADTLGFDADVSPPWLSTRGGRLYDNRIGDYYTGQHPLEVHIIRLVPLDDLPYKVQRLIQAAAVLDFQKSFDADEQKVRDAENAYSKAYALVNAEHIRAVKGNMLSQGSVAGKRFRQRILTPDNRYAR